MIPEKTTPKTHSIVKDYSNTSCGATVNIQVPESAEEFDSLAGREGAAADAAVRHTIYHSWNQAFRTALAEAVASKTGEKPRQVGTKTNDKGEEEPVLETDASFLNYVTGEGLISGEDYAELAQSVADDLPFDPSPTPRTGRVSKEMKALAESVVAGVESGATTAEDVVAKLEATPGVKVGEFTVDNVARAIKAREEYRKRQAASDLLA